MGAATTAKGPIQWRRPGRLSSQSGARSQVAQSMDSGTGSTLHQAPMPAENISHDHAAASGPKTAAKTTASTVLRTASEANWPAA